MVSKEQDEIICDKIKLVCKRFLESDSSIEDISKATGVSKSSVQRYLISNRVIEILGSDIAKKISDKLKEQLHEAKIKGGQTFAQNNAPTKEENGRFNGSIRK